MTVDEQRPEAFVPAMQQAVRLLSLHELALDAALATNLPDLAHHVVETALRLCEADSASLYLWEAGDGALHALAHAGEAVPAPPLVVRAGEGFTGAVWAQGATLAVDVFAGWPEAASPPPGSGLRATLGAPLVAADDKLGVLIVRRYTPAPAFAAEERRLLGLLAAQAAHLLAGRRAEEMLRASEARFRALVYYTSDILILLSTDGTIEYLSPAAERILGRPFDQFAGHTIYTTVHTDDTDRVRSVLDEVSGASGTVRVAEYRQQRADGSWVWVEAILRNSLDDDSVRGIVVTARDITQRKQTEELLQHQALHDALTGLPNFALLQDRLQHALRLAFRQRSGLALLYLDVDQFKDVNDRFGHQAGDLLLQEMTLRLQAAVRDSDTLARLSGNAFAVVLPGAREADADVVAQKIQRAFEQPFVIDGRHLNVNVNVGIALFPDHGADAETLMRHADTAMYAARRSGVTTAYYGAADDAEEPSRLTLLAELRRALAQRWLLLHYQPVVAMPDGRVVRAEALVRWQHPERGLLPPDQFIPLAEQAGLIAPLTRWVLATALRQCRAWRLAGLSLGVTVNLPARPSDNALLADMLSGVFAHLEVEPGWLTFGLTDAGITGNLRAARTMLEQLDATGVRLSIEGIGGGQFSGAYLSELPVDEIKVDRALVGRIAADPAAAATVRAIIERGHAAGLEVVAEGVEDQATWDLLIEMDCDAAQGFYVGRPMPAGLLAARVQDHLPTV